MNKFSHRIRELRKENGLRQKDLAMSLGLAQTTIANYEQGTRFPDEEVLKKISNHFQVSTDYLLGITDIKSRLGYNFKRKNIELSDTKIDVLIEIIKNRYISLILDGNKHIASELILEAIAKWASIKKIYLQVFEYNLKVIGSMWERGEIDVAQEHYFTTCTKQIMAQLYPYIYSTPKNGHSIVLLTVGGELHNMGIRIITDFLEIEGYNTYFLGSNMPTQSVMKAIDLYKAEILALSVTMSYNVDSLINLIQAVKKEEHLKNTKIIVGGNPFNLDKNLWKHIGADGYSQNAEEVVSLVNSFF
ncbi:MAG: cobalamin-dependent protein [Clostridium sp.]|nr:cobalamin-dependent protein [Clostridium sp.]